MMLDRSDLCFRRQKLFKCPVQRAGLSPDRYPATVAQASTRSILPRTRDAVSGVVYQIGSRTFRTKPVSIAEIGSSLIIAVAAGKISVATFVSLKVAPHWAACLSFFHPLRLALM